MANNQPTDELDELFDEYYPKGTVVANDNVDDEKAHIMTLVLEHRRNTFKARLLQWGTRQRLDERQKITYPKLNGFKDFSSHTDWSKAQFWEAPITIMQEENRERKAELQASLKDGGKSE